MKNTIKREQSPNKFGALPSVSILRVAKKIMMVISFIGLALTIVPSILVFQRVISMEFNFALMTAGMIMWFVTAPLWMKSQSL